MHIPTPYTQHHKAARELINGFNDMHPDTPRIDEAPDVKAALEYLFSCFIEKSLSYAHVYESISPYVTQNPQAVFKSIFDAYWNKEPISYSTHRKEKDETITLDFHDITSYHPHYTPLSIDYPLRITVRTAHHTESYYASIDQLIKHNKPEAHRHVTYIETMSLERKVTQALSKAGYSFITEATLPIFMKSITQTYWGHTGRGTKDVNGVTYVFKTDRKNSNSIIIYQYINDQEFTFIIQV